MLGVRAAGELVEIAVSLVAQLLDQPDLRGVITVDGVGLDRIEKLYPQLIFEGRVLPRRKRNQQCSLLLGSSVLEIHSVKLVALLVHPGKAAEKLALYRRVLLAEHQVYEFVDLGRLCARRIGRRDDQLRKDDYGLVLMGIEEQRLPRGRRCRRRRRMDVLMSSGKGIARVYSGDDRPTPGQLLQCLPPIDVSI